MRVEVFIKSNQKKRGKSIYKDCNKPMPGFTGFFRTIAHAFHATFAIQGPEQPVVNLDDCMNRTFFDAQTTIVTVARGIIRFGKKEAANQKISQGNGRKKDIVYFNQGLKTGFSL
jgi:hypothetical protein